MISKGRKTCSIKFISVKYKEILRKISGLISVKVKKIEAEAKGVFLQQTCMMIRGKPTSSDTVNGKVQRSTKNNQILVKWDGTYHLCGLV